MGVLVVGALASVGVIAVVFALFVGHRLARERDSVDYSWQQLEAHVRHRHEVISVLVDAAGRRHVFDPVVRARTAAEQAEGSVVQASAEQQLTAELTRALGVVERDPRLMSNRRYMKLRAQLTDVENRIAYSRKYFNDAVRSHNRLVTTLPANVVARISGHGVREPFAATGSAISTGAAKLHS